MTDWRRTFRGEFFGAWRRAGLPDPGAYERTYEELRAATEPPAVPAGEASGPLDPGMLRSVHGFGYAMGAVFADLLQAGADRRGAGASWCARFNLGISLVDWLCDEAKLPAREIAGLPAFAPLAGRLPAAPPSERAAVRFLDGLARDLLAELERDAGPPLTGEPRSALWPSLRRLLRVELAVAGNGSFNPSRPSASLGLLRLKSVEPFRIMAERCMPPERPVGIARRVGRAVGECVWLADDADDIWRDLDAGSGNRFVIEAAAIDTRVLSADGAAVVDVTLLRVLRRERVAERLSARAVGRLAGALRSAPCGEAERQRAAGLVGAALAHWAT